MTKHTTPPIRQTIEIVWHIDDVKELRSNLTDAQCLAVLDCIQRQHDACVGVNWEVIETVADILYPALP